MGEAARPVIAPLGFGGGEYTKGFILKAIERACYADCDPSTTAPAVDVDDSTCFISRPASGRR